MSGRVIACLLAGESIVYMSLLEDVCYAKNQLQFFMVFPIQISLTKSLYNS